MLPASHDGHKAIMPKSGSVTGSGRLDSSAGCIGRARCRERETVVSGTGGIRCSRGAAWCGISGARCGSREAIVGGTCRVRCGGRPKWFAISGARSGGREAAIYTGGCSRRRDCLPAGRRNHANQGGDKQYDEHGDNGGNTHGGLLSTDSYALRSAVIVAPFAAVESAK
jgi:hypothetical protein